MSHLYELNWLDAAFPLLGKKSCIILDLVQKLVSVYKAAEIILMDSAVILVFLNFFLTHFTQHNF